MTDGHGTPMNLQTIQLRAFAALADQGSYTRVAKELSYTEPAVNMQIKSLERTVGMPLVHREGKRILLTAEGRQLLPSILELLDRHGALETAIRRLRPAPRLVVGAGRHCGVFVMMPALADYRRVSGAETELHILSADQLVAAIVEGRVEVVVAGIADEVFPRAERLRSHLVRVPWTKADQEWVIVAQPAIAARRLPARARGSTMVFVPAYASGKRLDVLMKACRDYFADPHLSVLETADAVLGAAENGLGAAVLPASSVRGDRANLLKPLGTISFPPSTVHIIHSRTKSLSPEARRFVSHLVSKRKRSLLSSAAAEPRQEILPATGSRRTSGRGNPIERVPRMARGVVSAGRYVPET